MVPVPKGLLSCEKTSLVPNDNSSISFDWTPLLFVLWVGTTNQIHSDKWVIIYDQDYLTGTTTFLPGCGVRSSWKSLHIRLAFLVHSSGQLMHIAMIAVLSWNGTLLHHTLVNTLITAPILCTIFLTLGVWWLLTTAPPTHLHFYATGSHNWWFPIWNI